MLEKNLNRFVALGVFIVTLVVYLRTMSGTVVFWDVGEFCAAAYLLQVPHPPGSPLFLLIGRVVSMLPFFTDIAARIHAISAFSGALGVMFLYLISVKLISLMRGTPSTTVDRLIVFGSSAVGALSLAFSKTYWFNSTEAEVYGLSMLFVAVIVWLALRWSEQADEPHNEKYMLLIAFLIGLSIGIHLLSLLAIFTILMIVYFRRYPINLRNTIIFGIISVVTFFVIYPGIVQYLPSMLDGEFKGQKSAFFSWIPPLIIIAAIYGVHWSKKNKHKMIHVACLSFLLIVIGFTTYIGVIIRSNVQPPMNENNPNNLERLIKYLSREQYGDTPLFKGISWDNDLQDYREKFFPRRHSTDPMHQPTRTNYTSDMDFFWRYQIDHMFLRYLLWNFVGVEGDWQDAGVSWKYTWGIPLFLGLFGLVYHYRRDWKNFLPIFTMFMVMGFLFAVYANMQEPQPRERDYFYVGAFFAFCIWIGIGVVGLIEIIRKYFSQPAIAKFSPVAILIISTIIVPARLLTMNWHQSDRSQNYFAWDYAYNLLQSCEQDAILFTNGDNDTFPLWYIQDVEGVRRDIRIVNLSLINTDWYILQQKNETPHGAKKVPISLSNKEIENIRPRVLRKPEQIVEIPLPKDIALSFGVTDSTLLQNEKIVTKMKGIPVGEGYWMYRVQDIMVYDIIKTNKWERPIYFAVTVSPDSKIGLDEYLWMRGLAWKLKPLKSNSFEGGIDYDVMAENVLAVDVKPSKTPQNGFLYRNLNNPNVYYDENIQRMVMNYRASFIRLAFYAMRNQNDFEKAKNIMRRMEHTMPLEVHEIRDWRYTADIMNIFKQVGDMELWEKYAKVVEKQALSLVDNPRDPRDFNHFAILIDIYDTRRDFKSGLELLEKYSAQFPDDRSVQARIEWYRQQLKQEKGTDTTQK